MDFNCKLNDLFQIQPDGLVILTKQNLNSGRCFQQSTQYGFQNNLYNNNNSNNNNNQNQHNISHMSAQQKLQYIINYIGELSRIAQGLGQIITTYEKLATSNDILLLKCDTQKVYGLLRIGQKNLFYSDNVGKMHNIQPQCVLDFYVHESCQRSGIGKFLFEKMLEQQNNLHPEKLAYDRPSIKLKSFLKKYYGLQHYIPQNNNYVIFDSYFSNTRSQLQENTNQIQKNQSQRSLAPSIPQQNPSQLQQISNNAQNNQNYQQSPYNMPQQNQQFKENTIPKPQQLKKQQDSLQQILDSQQKQHHQQQYQQKQHIKSHTLNNQQFNSQQPQQKQYQKGNSKNTDEEIIKLQREIEQLNRYNREQQSGMQNQNHLQKQQDNYHYMTQMSQKNKTSSNIFGNANYGNSFQTTNQFYGQEPSQQNGKRFQK